VVTLLTVPLPELPLELELSEPLDWELELDVDPVSDPELVVVAGDELDATVAADELLASAGSCPDTSTIVISSHDATNSATDPATIRRRIMRARASRAPLIAWPRARAASALLSVMVRYLVVVCRAGEAWP
jgi:hypothetical protein